jgi:hypothetical protein
MADAGIIGPLDTSAARQEKAKLRKVLGRLDLVLFTACAILGYDTVAATAEASAQAITWLVISLVSFLIPYGMLMAELGRRGSALNCPTARPRRCGIRSATCPR